MGHTIIDLDGDVVQIALPTSRTSTDPSWRSGVQASTNVKEYWYPLSTSSEICTKRPHGVRILGEPLVLYRDGEKKVRAMHDRCPHKNAQLSAGRVEKGVLECFYHGWKFDGDSGAITDVPSIPKGCPLPKQRVKTFPVVEQDDLIWVYPGDSANADPAKIPTKPIKNGFKEKGYWRSDVMLDLPCDHSFFVENLMDMAHTPWAHDGVFNSRKDAIPIDPDFRVTPGGMAGRLEEFYTDGYKNSLDFEWTAPCTNEVDIHRHNSSWHLHMFFYSVPTAPGQMRHIFVMYRNWGYFIQYIPRSLRSMVDLMVIHGDCIGMMSQARNMKEGCPHMNVATPSDDMAIKYRKWHSKAFGGSGKDKEKDGPWWKGWNGKLDIEDLAASAMETCMPSFGNGVFEQAALSTCSTKNAEHLETMWKVQRRWRKPLGFERPPFPAWALLGGFVAGALAVLAAQRRK